MSEDDSQEGDDEKYNYRDEAAAKHPRSGERRRSGAIIASLIVGLLFLAAIFFVDWEQVLHQINNAKPLDTAKKNLGETLKLIQVIPNEPYLSQTPAERKTEVAGATNLPIPTEETGQSLEKISSMKITELEQEVHNWANHYRKENGVSELKINLPLAGVARNHSQDMADLNYFSHINLKGEDPTARAERQGFNCHIDLSGNRYVNGVGENIWQGWTFAYTVNGVPSDYYTQDELAEKIVAEWMNSPSHREDLLTDFWQSEGIGIVITNEGKVYATEGFC